MRFLHGSIAHAVIVQSQQLLHLHPNGGANSRDTHQPMRHGNMAHATEFSTQTQSALGNGFAGLIAAFNARRARRKVFNQTFRELSSLSNRDLADLGLSRGEIRRVAYQAAYEA